MFKKLTYLEAMQGVAFGLLIAIAFLVGQLTMGINELKTKVEKSNVGYSIYYKEWLGSDSSVMVIDLGAKNRQSADGAFENSAELTCTDVGCPDSVQMVLLEETYNSRTPLRDTMLRK